MKFSELIERLRVVKAAGDMDCEITGLSSDSRTINQGDLFFAVQGKRFDGNAFIDDAINRGANAVISERDLRSDIYVPFVQVTDIYSMMCKIADRFYHHPSGAMTVIGITGTNGKTTTSSLLQKILILNSRPAGLIGTLGYITMQKERKAMLTTPDALVFQGLLAGMYEEGIRHVITEVSSHSLSMKRVDCTDFHISVFTNLTRDHLDFHGDMERYYEAKRRLLLELTRGIAIVNIDDQYGERLVEDLKRRSINTLTYGVYNNAADLKPQNIQETFEGLNFTVKSEKPYGLPYMASKREENDFCLTPQVYRVFTVDISSPLIGINNVYNILAAIGVSLMLGIPGPQIVEGVAAFSGVKGRMEIVREGQDFIAVVDYAHTPDALQKALQTLKRLTSGRIITVFGCGGDRDRGKRPLMGRIAVELSDTVVITSDNPRSEDPLEIIGEIIGELQRENLIVETDRRRAIKKAVQMACENDVVFVAGKGHEDYQEILSARYPFSDRDVLIKAISDFRLRIANC